MDAIPFRRVAVIGLGVMGGSLARALSVLPSPPRRTGWSPQPGERAEALASGALDEAPDAWEEAVQHADLVVLAAPLRAVCQLMAPVASATPVETVVIDVASLKEPVRRAAVAAGCEGRWVGCHPMCGSEASGFGASRDDLFHGSAVWLVSEPGAGRAGVLGRVEATWRALGAEPRSGLAVEHDRMMALVSHLPQLASNALARTLRDRGIGMTQLGPGGWDATRLAGSAPSMWADILAHAPRELTESLRELAERAGELANLLEAEELDAIAAWMSQDRKWRSET